MKQKPLFIAISLFLLAGTLLAGAADWPHWRGPNYDGSTEAENLPTNFSKNKKVKWVADLPGPSAATPVVADGKVFLSAADFENEELVAMAFDAKTGAELWRHNAGSGYQPKGHGSKLQLDNRSNYATPSPVTNGDVVVFFYGNGDLIAYNMAGEEQWRRNIQKDYGDFSFQWTFGSSPTLYEDGLFMQILQRDEVVHGRGKDDAESFILKINPRSGDTIWKQERPSNAVRESLEAYSTPIPYEADGRKEIIIAGGDILTGNDPETGEELWRWGTYNPGHREVWWRLVPSPVVGDGVVLVAAPKRAPIYAIKLGGEGDISESGLAWDTSEERVLTSDVPTPLFYKDHFYVLSDLRQAISKVKPNGDVVWTKSLRDHGDYLWRSSPTGADGKVWIMNHGGDVLIMDAGSGDVINSVPMGEPNDNQIRSSVVVADNTLYIRTSNKLFAVAN